MLFHDNHGVGFLVRARIVVRLLASVLNHHDVMDLCFLSCLLVAGCC
jgi:hypothetical protein